MLFSYKKIEAAIADTDMQIKRSAEGFAQELNAAKDISDLGERFLALMAIEEKIQGHKDGVIKRLRDPESDIESAARASSVLIGITAAGIGGISLALGGAPIGVVAFFLILAPIAPTVTFWQRATDVRRLKGAKDSLSFALDGLSKEVCEQKDRLIKNELPALVASSRSDELYKKAPAVRDAFIMASARESLVRPITKLDKPLYPDPKK